MPRGRVSDRRDQQGLIARPSYQHNRSFGVGRSYRWIGTVPKVRGMVDQKVVEENRDMTVRIPMLQGVRCLNSELNSMTLVITDEFPLRVEC